MTASILPKGSTFVRCAIALAFTKGDPFEALHFAQCTWGAGSRPALALKAAVDVGTVGGATWASPLAGDWRAAVTEFFAAVNQMTILGRLQGLRRVPLRLRIVAVETASTAYWAGEAKPKALTRTTFVADSLAPLKLIAMCVVTDELIGAATGDPDAEERIRQDLLRAVAENIDAAFVDPANAGVAGEQPASITNGITPVTATGDAKVDLKALIADFSGDLLAASFVMTPEVAAALAGADFRDIGIRGGELLGAPVIVSRSAPASSIILVDASAIAVGSGDAEIRVTRQAVIEMQDTPADPVDATTVLVSLWQQNLVGILTERTVNWSLGRPGVSMLENVNYNDPA